jgi:hypothetical protein
MATITSRLSGLGNIFSAKLSLAPSNHLVSRMVTEGAQIELGGVLNFISTKNDNSRQKSAQESIDHEYKDDQSLTFGSTL